MMGFNLNNKKSISDINVTPFVDVMLVLLVIFMMTAPLMFSGVTLELPRTREVNPINIKTQQVILSFTKEGNYYIGSERVLESELLPTINELVQSYESDVVFLRADYALSYGQVAQLMSFLRAGGITNIALITETDS